MARKPADTLSGELFSVIPQPMPITPGSLDFRKRVAGMVADSISAYRGKDNDSSKRFHLAARISELCDHDTSKAILDSYSAPSREECNLPFWKVPALEVASNSRLFTEFLVNFHGGRVQWGKDVLIGDLGEVESQIQKLMDLRRDLRAEVRRHR